MNERDELIKIIKVEFDIQFGCGDYIDIGDKEAFAEMLVDALIKSGYGNIKEWKEKTAKEKDMRELAEAFHKEKCAEYDLLNLHYQKIIKKFEQAEKDRDAYKVRFETAQTSISDLRSKLAKAEHDRKRYKEKIKELLKEKENENAM